MKERGVSVRVVVGCLLLLASVAGVSAVPNSWSGLAGNNNWADPGNWTGASFPQDGEDVVISDAAVDVKLTADTAWMNSFTMSNSTLICSNWTTEIRATNVTIRNLATVGLPAAFTSAQMSNRVYIVCTNFVLDAGGVIDADRKGFAGTYGDGAGGGTSRGGGAGHGGLGAYGNGSSSRGVVYGTASAPVQPGSGGGGSGVSPGAGGGAVRIDAGSGTVTVNGTIIADGGPTGGHGGGGSGGSVLIDCATFSGTTNGLISADGGSVSPTTYGQYGNGAGAVEPARQAAKRVRYQSNSSSPDRIACRKVVCS